MSGKNIIDKRIFYKLTISQRLLTKSLDKDTVAKLGVPVNQIAALLYISKNDGCLYKDLSRVLFQNKSATTTLVERMLKNGLIVKNSSETDGRATHIFLTEKGREISKKAGPLISKYNKKLMNDFDDAEIETIHKFLDYIIQEYS